MMKLIIILTSFFPCLFSLFASSQGFLPEKPDVEQIRKDLTGRGFRQVEGGYFGSDWCLEVGDESDIASVRIDNIRKQDGNLLYELRLIVKHKSASVEVFADVSYYLASDFKWKIDFVSTKDMIVVNTGKYDKCITSRIVGRPGEYALEITNVSDLDLLVGGMVRYEYQAEWVRFSVKAEAYGTASVGTWFLSSVAEYRIDFVEKF